MDVFLDTALAHSFRNFHAKGLDYICLQRGEDQTVKVYFLDGDVSRLPEVVNPHNHRYDFQTRVLAGALLDHVYQRVLETTPDAMAYHAFDYMTPLNGGAGFTYHQPQFLRKIGEDIITPNTRTDRVSRRFSDIHTITALEDQTVLLLVQGPDVVDLRDSTKTWVPARGDVVPEAPSLDGLYERFDPDTLIARLRVLEELTGQPFVLREGAAL